MSGIINSDADNPTVREAALALIRALDRDPQTAQLGAYATRHLAQLRQAADQEESSIVARLPNANWAREGIGKMIAQAPPNEVTSVHIRAIVEAAQVGLDANRSFAVRWAADQRAIKRWRAGDELPHCGELRPLLGEIGAFLRQMDDIHANAMADRLSDELEAAKPGNRETVSPDHADLVVWLLGRLVDWERIIELRDEEADSVSILSENPDADEHHPAFAIECCGFWTGFAERRFAGRTLSEAIELATIAKADARVAGYPDMAMSATLPQPVSAERFRTAMAALKRGMGGAPLEFEALARDQLDALELLGEAAALFRYYQASHQAKVEVLISNGESDTVVAAARAKAERNAAMANKIEAFLAPADADPWADGAAPAYVPKCGPSSTGVDDQDRSEPAAPFGGRTPDQEAERLSRIINERIKRDLAAVQPLSAVPDLGAYVLEIAPGWEYQLLDRPGDMVPTVVLTRYAPGEPL